MDNVRNVKIASKIKTSVSMEMTRSSVPFVDSLVMRSVILAINPSEGVIRNDPNVLYVPVLRLFVFLETLQLIRFRKPAELVQDDK